MFHYRKNNNFFAVIPLKLINLQTKAKEATKNESKPNNIYRQPSL